MEDYRTVPSHFSNYRTSNSKPSKLHIATQALFRLIKDEQTYHKEILQHKRSIERRKAAVANNTSTDVNDEYMIRQEEMAISQTEAMITTLHKRILESMENVKNELGFADDDTPHEELENAKRALDQAKIVLKLPTETDDQLHMH